MTARTKRPEVGGQPVVDQSDCMGQSHMSEPGLQDCQAQGSVTLRFLAGAGAVTGV